VVLGLVGVGDGLVGDGDGFQILLQDPEARGLFRVGGGPVQDQLEHALHVARHVGIDDLPDTVGLLHFL